MATTEKKTSLSDALIREDFKKKLKSWFENKGIDKKLELYLRSQMIVEFQNTVGSSIHSTRYPSLSPKLQAVKLLIADFLVQEDLLFSLSVFVSEVPFLNNLSSYSQYVKVLAQPLDSTATKPSKPKFSDTHLRDLFDALNLRLSKQEIQVIRTQYEVSNCGSLLVSLLSMLPVLLKKYRSIDQILTKMRQKEKYYRKVVKMERAKTKQMYVLLQEASSLVQKHKAEMNEALQKHRDCQERICSVEKQTLDLAHKENELTLRQKSLESREQACEQKYAGKLREVERKLKTLEDQDRELRSKYKILQEEQSRLQHEKQQFETAKSRVQISDSQDTEKLEQYERKLSALQELVLDIVKKSEERDKLDSNVATSNREIQCVFDTSNQFQQTENDAFVNIEEYVNLIEKENALLKLGSNKQRYRINQLTGEILTLRNRLDFLESEIKIKQSLERDEEIQHVAHKLYFPRSPRQTFTTPSEAPASATLPRSRRRLAFDEPPASLGLESSESSSTSLSATNKLTDQIVADAKNKLKELEVESEMLNHNFQNLQSVLTRNMAFAERSFLGSSSVTDSSPRQRWHLRRRLTRSVGDLNSSNAAVSPRLRYKSSNLSDFGESSPSSRTDCEVSPRSPTGESGRRTTAFSRIFQKYRQQKTTNDGVSRGDRVQRDERTPPRLHDKEGSAGENLQPNTESVGVNEAAREKDLLDSTINPEDSVNRNPSAQNERNVEEDRNITAEIKDAKIIIGERSAEDQKSTAENGGQSESTGRSNEVISVGASNGSSSSDFWK